MDEWPLISEKLDKLAHQVHELDKKIDLQLQNIRYELHNIKQLDNQQNAILEEHQKRTRELQRDNLLREKALKRNLELLEKRIQVIENARIWWSIAQKRTLTVLTIIATIAGIIYTITKILS